MKERSENIKTGPAIDENEAQSLAALMRDPNWPVFDRYLTRIQDAAFKKHMRLDQGLESSGYFKGVWNLANDLIELPKEIGKQIFAKNTQDEEQGDY